MINKACKNNKGEIIINLFRTGVRKRKRPVFFPLFILLAAFVIPLLFFYSCHYYKLEQKLDPENAEFLSKVRYIITAKERKIFLELPDSDKENFKEEFWKRRDPDPGTEENEFKMEYFNRVEKANELFISEGKPGWLTDRGRIYILFGPPTDRITSPMSYLTCQEVWYYGGFPVVFVDSNCSGNFQLVTYELSSLRSLNLEYMHELSNAQNDAQQTIVGGPVIFDFNWKVSKKLVEPDRVEGNIFIDVPYANIWFKSEGDKLVTSLEISLKLLDSQGKVRWNYEGTYQVETDEEELKREKGKSFPIDIPFSFDKDLEVLRQGTNKLFASLKNVTGGDMLRKVMDFNF